MKVIAAIMAIALLLGVSSLAFVWWAWVQVLIEGERHD